MPTPIRANPRDGSETDEQTAARLNVSLADYHRVIAPVESNAGELIPLEWQLLQYLHVEFPATVGHIPLRQKISTLRNQAYCLESQVIDLTAERDKLKAECGRLEEAYQNEVSLCDEAETERDKLRESKRITDALCLEGSQKIEELKTERDTLRQRVERLERALKLIAESDSFRGGTFPLELQQIAREAL